MPSLPVPRPLTDLPIVPPVCGVFFDIDDTFTTEGLLRFEALAALDAWQRSGRLSVAVTGRPAGWCDHIARMWPVDAVIGENGAFWFRYDRARHRMTRRFLQDDATLAANRARFDEIARRVLAAVPGVAVSADQPYRACDLAIDFAEDVQTDGLPTADRVASLLREAGMHVKISSIHVNAWFGEHDKLSTTLRMAADEFGITPRHSHETIFTWAIRPMTRRCSDFSSAPSGWPMCSTMAAASIRCLPSSAGSVRLRALPRHSPT